MIFIAIIKIYFIPMYLFSSLDKDYFGAYLILNKNSRHVIFNDLHFLKSFLYVHTSL
ncbi:MAG: hypothetical protein CM15mP130_0460 [Verrucomicrobiota bacterium]|nr:MAG: hypothetical protein CM15mP130_0460 [Verrucomicrobiota bacterium]